MDTIMSVDVEEWFNILKGNDNYLSFPQWDGAQPRIHEVLPRMLDIFDENQAKATFFFLGWIAEKYPQLVKETQMRGHEIATHGYSHRLIYNQTRQEFDEEIRKSIGILEGITGKAVIGFRAPGFSIIPETEWAFDILASHGIKYDSSIFPGQRFHGQYNGFSKTPVRVITEKSEIIEFPQTVIDFGFIKLSCFGGGFLRLFPQWFFFRMAKILERKGRPLIV